MKRAFLTAGVAGLVLLAIGSVWLASGFARSSLGGVYGAPSLAPLSPAAAERDPAPLATALLTTIYEAFGQPDETAIRDTLATVATGDALEALYRERTGVLADGGLTAPDETIDAIAVGDIAAARGDSRITMSVEWDVIGTAGGDRARVRGNRYRAVLTLAPEGDTWRITDFALLDVDRLTVNEGF